MERLRGRRQPTASGPRPARARTPRSLLRREIWTRKGDRHSGPLHHADGFDLLTTRQFHCLVRQIVRPLRLRPAQSVLECGCGAGAFLASLLALHPGLKIAGIDYSRSLLEIARARLRGSFFHGDITALPFILDASYDHVLSFGAFIYLDSATAARRALGEMIRIAKPGGHIVVGEVSDSGKRVLARRLRATSHRDRDTVSTEDPDHLHLPKSFFRRIAAAYGVPVRIVDHATLDLAFWPTSPYRYSVYVRKPGRRRAGRPAAS